MAGRGIVPALIASLVVSALGAAGSSEQREARCGWLRSLRRPLAERCEPRREDKLSHHLLPFPLG
jgi:hypothetical protein